MHCFRLAQLQAQIALPTPDSCIRYTLLDCVYCFHSENATYTAFVGVFADDDDTILCGRNTTSETE